VDLKEAMAASGLQKSPEYNVFAYTDGACAGNPGPAGAAAIVFFENIEIPLKKFLGRATNNIAELEAIKMAMELVNPKELIGIRIFTDSKYAINACQSTSKIWKNKDLVKQIWALMDKFREVEFIHVAGHQGDQLQERADGLAKEAIRDGLRIRKV